MKRCARRRITQSSDATAYRDGTPRGWACPVLVTANAASGLDHGDQTVDRVVRLVLQFDAPLSDIRA